MLRAIQQFFDEHLRPRSDEPAERALHRLQLATTALLVEMGRADFELSDREQERILAGVRQVFGLSPEEGRELVALAREEAEEATDLHQFTSLIHRHFDAAQKRQVVEMLWRVALADGHKHDLEEHLVRKVAELLYVPHQDFIAIRLAVEKDLGRG